MDKTQNTENIEAAEAVELVIKTPMEYLDMDREERLFYFEYLNISEIISVLSDASDDLTEKKIKLEEMKIIKDDLFLTLDIRNKRLNAKKNTLEKMTENLMLKVNELSFNIKSFMDSIR